MAKFITNRLCLGSLAHLHCSFSGRQQKQQHTGKVMQCPNPLCFLVNFLLASNPANCLIPNECTCAATSVDAAIICQWQQYKGRCFSGCMMAWHHLKWYQAVTECRQAGSGKVYKSQILATNSFSLVFILNFLIFTFPHIIRRSLTNLAGTHLSELKYLP